MLPVGCDVAVSVLSGDYVVVSTTVVLHSGDLPERGLGRLKMLTTSTASPKPPLVSYSATLFATTLSSPVFSLATSLTSSHTLFRPSYVVPTRKRPSESRATDQSSPAFFAAGISPVGFQIPSENFHNLASPPKPTETSDR